MAEQRSVKGQPRGKENRDLSAFKRDENREGERGEQEARTTSDEFSLTFNARSMHSACTFVKRCLTGWPVIATDSKSNFLRFYRGSIR